MGKLAKKERKYFSGPHQIFWLEHKRMKIELINFKWIEQGSFPKSLGGKKKKKKSGIQANVFQTVILRP